MLKVVLFNVVFIILLYKIHFFLPRLFIWWPNKITEDYTKTKSAHRAVINDGEIEMCFLLIDMCFVSEGESGIRKILWGTCARPGNGPCPYSWDSGINPKLIPTETA